MFDEFYRIGRDLFLSGQNDSHSGNISVRDGSKIKITAKSAMLSNLLKEDILEIDLDGSSENEAQATRDLFIHKAIYKIFGAKAVIHSHSPYGAALSISESKVIMQDMKGQSIFAQGVPVIRIRQGSSYDETEKNVNQVYNGYKAFMIKGHGVFVMAERLEAAFEYVSSFENSCKIVFASRLLQPKPQPMPQVEHHRKRSAIPPGIGVMDRRGGGFRRDIKR